MNQEAELQMQRYALEAETEKLKTQQAQRDLGQMSMFGNTNPESIILAQLDLSEELERIEHLLKGHILKRDKEGNEYWAEPPNDDLKPFNEYGVQCIMNVISFYLNKNTILSNYKEEMINRKMENLGYELADMIFMKYEEMGMNTSGKKKLYPMILREIIDTIHSAYLRALNGEERRSLRQTMHITESNNGHTQPMYPGQMQRKGILGRIGGFFSG